MRYLHGIHDIGGEHLHGDKPGWTLVTEEVGLNPTAQGRDYRFVSNLGIGVLVRLNHDYGIGGTLPAPDQYPEFAAACASFVATSQGVAFWIIGNEPNHEAERPNGVYITPAHYAVAFALCRNAIKEAVPGAKVLPAAVAPFHANPIPWTDYLLEMLERIRTNGGCDGFTVHAYTRGMDAENVTSDARMGPPLHETSSGFLTYRDALACVPASMNHLPAFVTEMDVYEAWQDVNTGVILAMYTELARWNQSKSKPTILAGICFRWLVGINHVDWGMQNKPNLLTDFRQVVATGFRTPMTSSGPLALFLPSIHGSKEKITVPTIERTIGETFLQRTRQGITYAQPNAGQTYYALVRAEYVPNAAQRFGPDHHILVDVLGLDGKRKMGQPVIFTAGDESFRKVIDKPTEVYGVDYPMFRNGYGHGVFVEGVSDRVTGMGLGTIEQPDWNHHVSYFLVFREMVAEAVPATSKPSAARLIPRLYHPVAEPRFRTVTQAFGARPEYYRRFAVDGVPLKGHEGIDFGTPVGTAIRAVDYGQAVEVGDQGSTGYGRYVKLAHAWGESVYAHLSEPLIMVGATVTSGQPIGRSGQSGNAEGPHLHFGLRVAPFDRRDGWGGYTDPAPFLRGAIMTPETEAGYSKAQLLAIVLAAAGEMGVDWRVLVSLIHAESSFNPQAVNATSGAKGLGQLMDATWTEWAARVGVSNIFDAQDNARVAAAYLKWCIEQVGGSTRRGLWAYVWGVGNVQRNPQSVPDAVVEYATKVIHGAEVAEIVK